MEIWNRLFGATVCGLWVLFFNIIGWLHFYLNFFNMFCSVFLFSFNLFLLRYFSQFCISTGIRQHF